MVGEAARFPSPHNNLPGARSLMPSAHFPSSLQVQLSLWREGEHPPSPELATLSFSTSHPQAGLGSSWQERDGTAGEVESRIYARSYSRAKPSCPFLPGLQRSPPCANPIEECQ